MSEVKLAVFDVGGTSIKYARSDGSDLQDLDRVPTDAKNFIPQLAGLVLDQCDNGFMLRTDAVIAVPGPTEAKAEDTTVGPFPNITGETATFQLRSSILEARPELKERLGRLFILNDAQAAAHAVPGIITEMGLELPQKTLYVIHGTGVGSRLINGREPADLLCEIGEAVTNLGPGVTQEKLESTVSGGAIEKANKPYTAEDLSKFHDATTNKFWDELGSRFGYGLASFVPILGPNLILIGGGVSRAFDRYGDALQKSLHSRLKKSDIGNARSVEVAQLPPEFVDTIGLLGCLAAYQKAYPS